jgi:putative PIN family toxin of toxin-antitoxin system
LRIVLDTNVSVSALIHPAGIPARAFDLVVARQVAVALDHRIFAEYHAVLLRPEFSLPRDRVTAVLDFLWRCGEVVQAEPLSLRLPDPDDAMFVEVALTACADALVTGNARHFSFAQRHDVRVLTPRAFLDFWANRQV